MAKVSMPTKELKDFVVEVVEEKLKEILGEPDYDLKLKDGIKKRLRRTFKAEEKGERGIPAEEFAKKFGVEW